MIRTFLERDLTAVMRIWHDTNVKAHSFIPEAYWNSHFASVKEQLPQAEIYVFEHNDTQEIEGFLGLMGSYIAGIFVREASQSKGIGKQLMNYVKEWKSDLELNVYQKNTRAVRFYLREQFAVQAEQMDEDAGEKEFFMVWKKYSNECLK